MELNKFIEIIRKEEIEEVIVRTKDRIYRWTEDKTYIAPLKKYIYNEDTSTYLDHFFTDEKGNICIKGTIYYGIY